MIITLSLSFFGPLALKFGSEELALDLIAIQMKVLLPITEILIVIAFIDKFIIQRKKINTPM